MNFKSTSVISSRRMPVEINLTSMVDIIFNLLLFFMLTASLNQTPGLEITLPKAQAAGEKIAPDELEITISKDGTIRLENELVKLTDLAHKLAIWAKTHDSRVVLRADEGVSYGQVVQVLDLAKQNGIKTVAIATQNVS